MIKQRSKAYCTKLIPRIVDKLLIIGVKKGSVSYVSYVSLGLRGLRKRRIDLNQY